MKPAPLQLKKDQERRILAGHCWIYSNEVDTQVTPLKGLEPGQPVEFRAQHGRWLGHGYVNPNSLIAARVVSRDRSMALSPSLWIARIRQALALRERLYKAPFYRLIFGESDGLPGLVVDRYGDLLAVQITTAGMERVRGEIIAALEQVLRPKTIVLRNDTTVREMEGLPLSTDVILGEIPEHLELEENGAKFQVAPLDGQKTGWFFDQAENRARLQRFGPFERVLDVCSYVGAWGIQTAVAGAEQTICVDSSADALAQVEANAVRNGVVDRMGALQGDAFAVLKTLKSDQEGFDLVLLDPPAFIKRRKDEKEGLLAYRRLNQLGMDLLTPGGLLVTSSCSFHMDRDRFQRTVQQAARRAGKHLQLLETGQQGPDHPVHPAIPETSYLKTLFFRVLPEF